MTARIRPRPLTNLQRALADPSRHVHVLADDPPTAPKIHRVVVAPDPKALPAEFFRAVKWELVDDPAPCAWTSECPPCAMFAAPRDVTEVQP